MILFKLNVSTGNFYRLQLEILCVEFSSWNSRVRTLSGFCWNTQAIDLDENRLKPPNGVLLEQKKTGITSGGLVVEPDALIISQLYQ